MIIRKQSSVVHRTLHYKLYKSGKYLVTSAIMGLSVLGALTFDNPTRVHADSTAKAQSEEVNEDGNAVTTTSASATPKTSSNNEQSINTDSKVNQETAPARATEQTTNSTANNLEQGQTSGDAATNRLNIINLNAALQQSTQSSQNEKSLMTNLAVSNEAAQTDVVNKVKATGVTPNTNQIVALTDYGAKGDSQTDDTQALQKALDSINQAGGGILDIPAGNYMIKATNATNEEEATIPWQTNQGVKVPSNTTLYFEKGAKFSVIPNASWNYCLLNLTNSKNVNILNGELVGDRDKHDTKYTKNFRTTTKYQGETGWGILMAGAQNVNIIGNNIHDFWGDGIDLYGDNANPGVNQNIVIKNNTLNHNRRQGISVENVNGLVFDHNLVENTDGTAPRAGMDIEPANFKDPSMRIAHDITITNNTFRNNNGSGLMTYGLSTHAEGFSDGPSRISNLTIKNNTFDGNNTNSFAVEGTASEGAWNWQQNMNGQLTVLGTSNATAENNKFINPNPKGININEANGDANAVIAANTYKTAGMFVGFNENAQIHNNYLQGQDIFVTGNQSPSYAFNNISGSVTNNYANGVIANGTLDDATKKAVVPDGQNYKDTVASASFIANTGVPESNSDQTIKPNQPVDSSKGESGKSDNGTTTGTTHAYSEDPIAATAPDFSTWEKGSAKIEVNAIVDGQTRKVTIDETNPALANKGYVAWNGNIDGHTYSYSHGGIDSSLGWGPKTGMQSKHPWSKFWVNSTPIFYHRVFDNRTEVARDYDLGNGNHFIALDRVTTDGLIEHFLYFKAGNSGYSVPGTTLELDTMLDDEDGIPVIADGHDGAYIKGAITLWLQPVAGVAMNATEWPGDPTDASKQNWPLKGAPFGKVMIHGTDTAIDYHLKPVEVAPNSTKMYGFRETIFPDGMDPVHQGTVRAVYIDQDGNEVAQAELRILKIGDSYTTQAKEINGYTLEKMPDNASGKVVGGNTEVQYIYQKIVNANASYQFVDDTENEKNVGNAVTLTGRIGTTISTNLQVPVNYQLANGQSLPSSVMIQNNAGVIKIHLVHVTQSVNDSKTINRTINVMDPNGKVTTTKQSATINRQGTKDLVTNQITWNNWSMALLPEYDVPKPDGYHASQDKVTSQQVTAASQDSTVNISYVANAQSINILYKDGNKVVKTVPLTGKTGDTVDVNIAIPEHYHVTNQVVKNYTFKASENPDIIVELGHDTQIVSDSKTVTRTINVTDPNGQKTNHVQTVTLTRTGAKDLVTGQTSWSAWSTGSFPSYQTPEIDGYTANQSVPAMTVTSDTQDSTVNINYQKNASVLDQIKNYKYLYMGFDPSQATKQDPWKATVALTVSNDGVNWKLIKEYPQLGTFRDADINKIGDTYYIVGTLGAYKTKDLEHFEPVDFSAISSKQDDGTYHDTWAPELFQDLSGRWHVIYCAKTKNNQRNVYLADFDPATGSITNAWTQINGLHAIDPHIWTHNNQYYLTLNGTHLYTANDYQGPWTKLKTNLADTLATTGHWYEAGETLTDGNKLYYYFDNIYANSDLPEDSGHMMVTTADINGPTKWTTPEPVQSSITMRHGSFINQQQAPLSFTIKVVDTDNNNQEVNSTQVSSLPANYDSFVPTNYELAGYKLDNQVLTLSLRHQKQAVTDSKTVKRQIILNRPERQIDATQEVTLTRTGTNDLVTGKTTWADWPTGTFQKLVPPVIQGYTASQSIVPAEHVDGNTKDSTVTVSYSPSQQTINIKYLDGAHVIKTVPVTGNTGENVDINVDVPVHYHVANHVPKTYLLKAEGNEDVVVELAHNMQNVNDSKTIQRVINLTAPDGKQTTTKQSATITRRGSKDLVTNQTTWDNWNLATLPNYEVPSFAGYQPTLTKVEAEPVDGDTKDSTIDISYVADKQSVNIIYKDGQQIIKTVPLTGKTGETVKVPINVPTNYHLKNQPADSYTFKANDNPDVVVELEHDTQSTDDFKVVTRVIKITHPDGQVTTDTQKATITRKGSKDKVTGNIAWNNWSTAKWDQYNATKIPGYTSTMSVVSEQVVTSDTPDTTVEIKYVANPQQANIIYKDGDQVVKTTVLKGNTDETVKVPVELPTNYHVDGKAPTDYTFEAKGNHDIVINLDHDTQTVSQSKTVKRTIKLELPGETDKPVVQQVTFTRHGIKDLVTGKTTWGSWDHNGKYQFDSYTPQTIAGYEATSDKVDSLLVTPESKDSEITISYHKLATKLTVNPQTSQEPAAYTPKVQISQVSQPVVATQPKSEPQQELPHTGNHNEAALATGFMGLLLAIGSLGFGKKYRI